MKILSKYFVTLFGIGFIPFAPGSFGSLTTILIWYICIAYFTIFHFYIVVLITAVLSISFTNIYLKYTKKDDPSEVVIDEFLGQSLPLLFIFKLNLYEILLAFIVFRFFDIYKIYPVNKAENLKGSLGVILDDIIAGIYALIAIMLYKIIF